MGAFKTRYFLYLKSYIRGVTGTRPHRRITRVYLPTKMSDGGSYQIAEVMGCSHAVSTAVAFTYAPKILIAVVVGGIPVVPPISTV